MRPNAGLRATLVVNSDHSYCSACGGGALIEDRTHERLLGHAGLDNPDGGCGAIFVETATDEVTTPEVVDGICEVRPDLPFTGRHGFEGRA
jgi:hypothetical protein